MNLEDLQNSSKSEGSSSVFFSAKACDIDDELKNKIDSKMEPYSFLIKDDFGSAICLDRAYIKNTRIQCPHFSALLDHTIAILWGMFSKSPKLYEFRPAQIMWAIRFLEGIKNKNGDLSVDITKAVERMEKFIFYKYGQMNESSLSTLIDSSLEMKNANITNPKNKVSFTLHELLGDSYDSLMESYKTNSHTFLVNRESPKVKNRTYSIKENVPEKVIGQAFIVNEEPDDGKTFIVKEPSKLNNDYTFLVENPNSAKTFLVENPNSEKTFLVEKPANKDNTFLVAPESKKKPFLIYKKEITSNLTNFDIKELRTSCVQIKEETFVMNEQKKKKYFLES